MKDYWFQLFKNCLIIINFNQMKFSVLKKIKSLRNINTIVVITFLVYEYNVCYKIWKKNQAQFPGPQWIWFNFVKKVM